MGYVAVEGNLPSGGAWRFERALRNPAGNAESLVKALLAGLGARDSLGTGRWPRDALLDLSLTLSELAPETGRQSGLWTAAGRPALPEIDGVERLARMIPGSLLPGRGWAFASFLSALYPSPVKVSCADDVPRRIGAGGAVDKVVDLWEVDTEWWTGNPVRRLYWRLALTGGGLVTVYRDLITIDWFGQGY